MTRSSAFAAKKKMAADLQAFGEGAFALEVLRTGLFPQGWVNRVERAHVARHQSTQGRCGYHVLRGKPGGDLQLLHIQRARRNKA